MVFFVFVVIVITSQFSHVVRFDTTWGDFATNNSHIVRINTEWDIIPRRPRRSCRTERCG